MSLIWKNQHDTLPEQLLDLRSLEDAIELERELIEVAGVSRVVARSIPSWVLTRAAGQPDDASPNTRSRYRKALAAVLEHRPDGPGRLNGPRSRDRGAAHLVPMAGAAAGAASLMAADPRPAWALLAPIIHERSVMSSDELEDLAA